jgi:signal transduction histidine kinase
VRQLTAAARELAGPDLDPRAATLLERSVANSDRMLRLVEALLTYARAGAGSLTVSAVDLDAVISDALELLASDVADTGATIVVDAPHWVLGDRAALTIVIQNLLSNALRYRRPDEPPIIRVTAARDGDHVTVRVEDNGVGVSPEDRHRLFDLFGRGTDVPAGQGAGIGLATCQRLTERMGGDIRFEPSSTRGATFVVTLPTAAGHDAPSTSVHRPTDVRADVA